jgi:hypothetical protein
VNNYGLIVEVLISDAVTSVAHISVSQLGIHGPLTVRRFIILFYILIDAVLL